MLSAVFTCPKSLQSITQDKNIYSHEMIHENYLLCTLTKAQT